LTPGANVIKLFWASFTPLAAYFPMILTEVTPIATQLRQKALEIGKQLIYSIYFTKFISEDLNAKHTNITAIYKDH
jgi:hypothetical protein